MTPSTQLHRQIHPNHIRGSQVFSLAFVPKQGDDGLSVYDGDQITPADAFAHYRQTWGRASAGVLSVSVEECDAVHFTPRADPLPDCPEHALLIPPEGASRTKLRDAPSALRDAALLRGWTHQPPSV